MHRFNGKSSWFFTPILALLLICITIPNVLSPNRASALATEPDSESAVFQSLSLAPYDGNGYTVNSPYLELTQDTSDIYIGSKRCPYTTSIRLTGSSARMAAFYSDDTLDESERIPCAILRIPGLYIGKDGDSMAALSAKDMQTYYVPQFELCAGGRAPIYISVAKGTITLPLFKGESVLNYTFTANGIDDDINTQYSGSISVTYVDADPFVADTFAFITENGQPLSSAQSSKEGEFTLPNNSWNNRYIRVIPYAKKNGAATTFSHIDAPETRIDGGVIQADSADGHVKVADIAYADAEYFTSVKGIAMGEPSDRDESDVDGFGSMLLLNAAGALGVKNAATLEYSFTSGGKRWTSTLAISKTTGASVAPGNTTVNAGSSSSTVRGLALHGLREGDVLAQGQTMDIGVTPINEDGLSYSPDAAFRERFGYLHAAVTDPGVCGVYAHAPDEARLTPQKAGTVTLKLWYDGNGAYRTYEEAPAAYRLNTVITVSKTVEQLVRELLDAYLSSATQGGDNDINNSVQAFEYGHVACSRLNIRMEPTTKSRVLGTLQHWDSFIVGESPDEDWYALQLSDSVGYIAARYTVTQPYDGEVYYVVTTSATRLYASAKTSARTLASLKKNTHLLCTGESGAFYAVLLEGETVYLPKKYAVVM